MQGVRPVKTKTSGAKTFPISPFSGHFRQKGGAARSSPPLPEPGRRPVAFGLGQAKMNFSAAEPAISYGRYLKGPFLLGHAKTLPPVRGKGLMADGLILALACCFSFLFAFHTGLFIMLTLASLCQNTCTSTLPFKPLQSAFQGFVFADSYLGHCYPSPRSSRLALCSVIAKYSTVAILQIL